MQPTLKHASIQVFNSMEAFAEGATLSMPKLGERTITTAPTTELEKLGRGNAVNNALSPELLKNVIVSTPGGQKQVTNHFKRLVSFAATGHPTTLGKNKFPKHVSGKPGHMCSAMCNLSEDRYKQFHARLCKQFEKTRKELGTPLKHPSKDVVIACEVFFVDDEGNLKTTVEFASWPMSCGQYCYQGPQYVFNELSVADGSPEPWFGFAYHGLKLNANRSSHIKSECPAPAVMTESTLGEMCSHDEHQWVTRLLSIGAVSHRKRHVRRVCVVRLRHAADLERIDQYTIVPSLRQVLFDVGWRDEELAAATGTLPGAAAPAAAPVCDWLDAGDTRSASQVPDPDPFGIGINSFDAESRSTAVPLDVAFAVHGLGAEPSHLMMEALRYVEDGENSEGGCVSESEDDSSDSNDSDSTPPPPPPPPPPSHDSRNTFPANPDLSTILDWGRAYNKRQLIEGLTRCCPRFVWNERDMDVWIGTKRLGYMRQIGGKTMVAYCSHGLFANPNPQKRKRCRCKLFVEWEAQGEGHTNEIQADYIRWLVSGHRAPPADHLESGKHIMAKHRGRACKYT